MSPRSEFLAGARDIAPVLLGTIPFGLVAGVAAVSAGMSALEGVALSVFAFSGIAQLITSQLIAVDSPVLVTVGAALVVSLRLLMYSAALAPHLAHLDRRWRVLLAFLMTDQSFAMTMRIAAESDRPHFHWHFLGAGVTLYAAWQAAVILGVAVGAKVPASWSLDFAVTLTFIALLVPAVRTRADLAAAIVAAAVALIAAGLPYRLALVVAAIAGIAAGMAIERSGDASMKTWLVIAGVSAATYLLRASFIVFADPHRFPHAFRQALRFVPPAVLAAIVVPGLLMASGAIDASPRNARLLAGLIAMGVAARWRHPLAPIAAGMPLLWLLQWAMG